MFSVSSGTKRWIRARSNYRGRLSRALISDVTFPSTPRNSPFPHSPARPPVSSACRDRRYAACRDLIFPLRKDCTCSLSICLFLPIFLRSCNRPVERANLWTELRGEREGGLKPGRRRTGSRGFLRGMSLMAMFAHGGFLPRNRKFRSTAVSATRAWSPGKFRVAVRRSAKEREMVMWGWRKERTDKRARYVWKNL